MSRSPIIDTGPLRLECLGLQGLVLHLTTLGYQVIGPTVRDGAIVLETIENTSALPVGWTDRQEAGCYRLERRSDQAWFGYNLGPDSWKQYLHPRKLRMWEARRKNNGFEINTQAQEVPRYALLGVRGCELAAIKIQDLVLKEGVKFKDSAYTQRREKSLIIAVACTQAAATCFCTSMGTGPAPGSTYDLAITEVITESEHYFVLLVGSGRGKEIIAPLESRAASPSEIEAANAAVRRATSQITRNLDLTGLKEQLERNYEHPHWEDVAQRCLTCANCTMVCPTCFCTTVEDHTNLTGTTAERERRWDSCFTMDFSYIHGGSVRRSIASRYRQWLTHKLATWVDQFGLPGCVGCGRCITWCPVGIDLTAELPKIRNP